MRNVQPCEASVSVKRPSLAHIYPFHFHLLSTFRWAFPSARRPSEKARPKAAPRPRPTSDSEEEPPRKKDKKKAKQAKQPPGGDDGYKPSNEEKGTPGPGHSRSSPGQRRP